jgi:tetratricopeptide (TPR) repeat protein
VLGVVNADRGRYKEAIPFLERALELTKGTNIYRILAVAYAQTGRVQEAKKMLDIGFKAWPPEMKNLRFVMCYSLSSDLQRLERLAEGYLKAGLPGEPSGFYKVFPAQKLNGDEIRSLVFGQKVTGVALRTGKQWSIERSSGGEATIRNGDDSDMGKSWIENDMLCDQWDNLYEGLKDCWPVFRNPEGTPEKNDEYLGVPDYGIYPFSPAH